MFAQNYEFINIASSIKAIIRELEGDNQLSVIRPLVITTAFHLVALYLCMFILLLISMLSIRNSLGIVSRCCMSLSLFSPVEFPGFLTSGTVAEALPLLPLLA